MKNITILGSTGSIGTQSLAVCKQLGHRVLALSAHTSVGLLEEQARAFSPCYVVVTDAQSAKLLQEKLKDTPTEVLCGEEMLSVIAALPQNDVVLNSLVGMRGLVPTLCAIEAGKDVALANKETLVAGGKLVMEAAQKNNVNIYPVDSEHSAIFQCLQGNKREQLAKIILTASGGPFRGYGKQQLQQVTKTQALRHPNWEMGAKITIDSATLMNKGLEFIEAMWLFGCTPQQIEVVVHPQSIIHSMVEYQDGAVLAQLGVPNMSLPIQYALTYPDRLPLAHKKLERKDYQTLTFEAPDMQTFTPLADCIEAAKRGGLYPCLLNAANEQAVELFLADKISFSDILFAIHQTLDAFPLMEYQTKEQVLEADKQGRAFVCNLFKNCLK